MAEHQLEMTKKKPKSSFSKPEVNALVIVRSVQRFVRDVSTAIEVNTVTSSRNVIIQPPVLECLKVPSATPNSTEAQDRHASTSPSSPMNNDSPRLKLLPLYFYRPFRLMDLPLELREMVYYYALQMVYRIDFMVFWNYYWQETNLKRARNPGKHFIKLNRNAASYPMLLLCSMRVRCEALRPFIQANQFMLGTRRSLTYWFMQLVEMIPGFDPFASLRTLILQRTSDSEDYLARLIKRCSGPEHLIFVFHPRDFYFEDDPCPTLDKLHDYFHLQMFLTVQHIYLLTFECEGGPYCHNRELSGRKGGVKELLCELRDWMDEQYKACGATVKVEVELIVSPYN